MKTANGIVMVLVMLISSNSLWAGISSGGGMNLDDWLDKHAWFLNEKKPVKYCLKTSANLKLSEDELRELFVQGFAKWSKYVQKIFQSRFQKDNPPEVRFSRKLLERPNCEEDTELTLYFGVMDKRVKKHIPSHLPPEAMAIAEKYNIETGRAKGFIWFSEKFFKDKGRLKWGAAILHEVGHLFGAIHTKNTIMSRDLIWDIKREGTELAPIIRAQQIDGSQILIDVSLLNNVPPKKTPAYLGSINYDLKVSRSFFKEMVGRDPIGNPHAKIQHLDFVRMKFFDFKYALVDSKGEYTFPMRILFNTRSCGESRQMFARHLNSRRARKWFGDSLFLPSCSMHGHLKNKSGDYMAIVFEQNLNTSQIIPEEEIDRRKEFRSTPYNIYLIRQKGKKQRIFGSSLFF